MNLVIFGAPGSGKGTQSELLVKNYGMRHISTGELLRDHISKGTKLGKVADIFISKGLLIPDELMIEVLADTLLNDPEYPTKGLIFDGFPRTIAQAEALSKLLESHNSKIDAVIGLEVDEDKLITRMLERGKATGRADDNTEVIKKRLEVYHKQTSPLRYYYMAKGNYYSIDGNGTVDAIFDQIKTALA